MSNNPLLPILGNDLPRKSTSEKYGGLLYLGVGGLIALMALIGLFGYGVWSMRAVWSDVYLLSDESRSEVDRVNAARRLARDPRVTDRQRWDLAMNRRLPPLARYLLAERLTAEATLADPRAYAVALARSTGWPTWLRPLVMRPIVYAASVGHPVDTESLSELQQDTDNSISAMASLSLTWNQDPKAVTLGKSKLTELSAKLDGPLWQFVRDLQKTSELQQPKLREVLDAMAPWLREHGVGASEVWQGWRETESGMIRVDREPSASDPNVDRRVK